jgi:hypothetical protein
VSPSPHQHRLPGAIARVVTAAGVGQWFLAGDRELSVD